jgi:hypothetical protein
MRLAVLPSLLLLAAACTGGDEPQAPPNPSEAEASPSLIPVPGGYVYRSPGLEATFELDGERGSLTVYNATGYELDAPGLYLLDARDGTRIDAEVEGAEPVPDGATDELEVAIDGAPEAKHVGLVLLTFGDADFGSFVPAKDQG